MNRKPLINNSGTVNEIVPTDYLDVGGVQLNTTTTPAVSVGGFTWDEGNGTASLGLKGGVVNLQIGQEQVTLCYNGTGSTLTDGQVVYITGAQGSKPSIALASNTAESSSSVTLGVVTESILSGAEGFITTSGIVRGLNTFSFSEGAAVWLGSSPGTITTTKPLAPNHSVLVGYVVKSHSSAGELFVHIQNGYELDELHNVVITTPSDKQVLQYNGTTSIWENKALGDTVFLKTDTIPIVNGGTGATTSIAALNNLRVFIQTTTPASPQEGDLWFDIS